MDEQAENLVHAIAHVVRKSGHEHGIDERRRPREAPRAPSKDPAELEAEKLAAAGDGTTGPVRGPITYSITLGGKTHSVSVKPA